MLCVLVFDQLQVNGGTEERLQALVVVVTPLTAIMEDQVYHRHCDCRYAYLW